MSKQIPIFDDEPDVPEIVEEELYGTPVGKAMDRKTVTEMIHRKTYHLAMLDIMGVKGLTLLEKAVRKGAPE